MLFRRMSDFIAASMIKSEKEIYAIRGLLHENIKLIAKIEHPQAVSNIEKIIDASDMILVARGDLGVELPITEVPTAQKAIVSASQRKGKPVIIATQLLDSMMHESAAHESRSERHSKRGIRQSGRAYAHRRNSCRQVPGRSSQISMRNNRQCGKKH